MTPEKITDQLCHGGSVTCWRHRSEVLGLDAQFSVFQPAQALRGEVVPVLFLLAGLTCMHETFLQKSTIIAHAAEHGLMLVAPDTSPRGAGIAGEEESYDLGTGAGFYLDALITPWDRHYRMGSYIDAELPALLKRLFTLDGASFGIMGHSMGGHGALVHGLRNPDQWRSISALAPIVHPSVVPWGEKAFTAYLGSDRDIWAQWDAVSLLEADRIHPASILIDQGVADPFLAQELRPDLIENAAAAAGQPLTLRYHEGYDHSYWFIQTVIRDHVAHHASLLGASSR
ncbi:MULTISPECIES: S-formylglutathione hydrolase [Asaia]|uniref:S-formylglutathione hydrolase n=1 Tax=Asaia bogorensis TaxID=91915 RepID=A0A060QBR1_9PROT|nr:MULTISPECIES: S-formylglutathione hydrolase [Asaia]MDL2169898.1 S-formylglutathione hydrolase [Asaia sp. HumB]CDG38123.1 S-formylglutathione hydrolase [Asaia bogorensis]